MNYLSWQITFKEIPDEVCLSILITGCPVRCKDCNSKDSWSLAAGKKMESALFLDILASKRAWITCVLFLGGEWHPKELVELLNIARRLNLKTALFSGLTEIDSVILDKLDYLKTGPYIKELGGLESKTTNQRLKNLQTGKYLNHFKEDQNDQAQRNTDKK